MTVSNQQKSILIPIACVLAILAFLFSLRSFWPVFQGNPVDELMPLAFNALTMLPAVIGLWKFTNRPVKKSMVIAFIIYGLVVVGGYVNVFYATDPLAAGLPMVMIVMPVVALFTIYLGYQLIRDRLDKNQNSNN